MPSDYKKDEFPCFVLVEKKYGQQPTHWVMYEDREHEACPNYAEQVIGYYTKDDAEGFCPKGYRVEDWSDDPFDLIVELHCRHIPILYARGGDGQRLRRWVVDDLFEGFHEQIADIFNREIDPDLPPPDDDDPPPQERRPHKPRK